MGFSNQWMEVNFGTGYKGLATVGYRLAKKDGSDSVARTTTGVVEITANSGNYGVEVPNIPDDAATIVWDTGGSTPVYATATIDSVRTGFEDGGVWIASTGDNAYSGRMSHPVQTILGATARASKLESRRLIVQNALTETLASALQFYTVISDDLVGNVFVNLNGQSVHGSIFKGIILTGNALVNDVWGAEKSILFGPMQNLGGVFRDCFFLPELTKETYTFPPDIPITLIRCSAGAVNAGSLYTRPTMSVAGVKVEVAFRAWSGPMVVAGLNNAGSIIEIDCISGDIEILNSCTAGTIIVRGGAKLTIGSGVTATVIDDTGQPGRQYQIETGVRFDEAMRAVIAQAAGRSTGGGTSNVNFRDLNNAKNRIAAVVDVNGNRTNVTLDLT